MKINDEIIRKYTIWLKLEKGLSANTQDAYLFDLQKFSNYVEDEDKRLEDICYADLQQFVACLYDMGVQSTSQARIISGIKSFYRFLLLDGYVSADPTELLEAPKKRMRLPEVLSVGEVDRLIESINLGEPFGHRNRAIFEVLYSCGLRVSELISLRISDLYIDEGFVRVEGKGRKQRLVPISEQAIREIHNYMLCRNEQIVKPEAADILFISRRGASLGRIMIFHLIKKQAESIGLKKTISPHTFRHSFATHLLEGGANLRAIQEMLGHESITTTEIYTHIDRETLRKQIIEHHPRSRV